MDNFPRGGLIGKARRIVRYLSRLQIPAHAAHAGYFIVLSVFPALVLLLSLLRYTGLEVEHFTSLVEGFLPEALMPYAKKLILNTYRNTSGTVIGISAVTALWSASRGIHGLISGLRAIYGVKTQRGYIHNRLVSLGYTFAFLLVLVLTLVVQVFGSGLSRLLPTADSRFCRFLVEAVQLRFFLVLVLQTGLFSYLFHALAGRSHPFRRSLPGGLLASFGWLVFSKLYSIYVAFSAGYASVYGSVYTVALSMLWLYFCLSILFYGGALNRYFLKNMEKP